MRMTELRNHPFLAIAAILVLVLLITRIPIKEHLPASDFASAEMEGILISTALVCTLVFIIRKLRVPHSYFAVLDPRVYLYYLPALVLALLPAHRLSLLLHPGGSIVDPGSLLLYGTARLARALFEEVLFRGAIFGLLLATFYGSRNGILKSVVISGALFGIVHISNVWTQPGHDAGVVTTQVYAAACLGVLYCATYLKTRSIVVLGIIHFVNNFFAKLDELGVHGKVVESLEHQSTIAETIASNMLGLVYYGLPLLAGLYIVKKISEGDVKRFLGLS